MRKTYFILFGAFIFTHSLLAMDEAEMAEGPKSLVINSNYEVERDILYRQLSYIISNYQIYLPKSLGCECCQDLKKVLNTPQKVHIEKRIAQVDGLQKLMKNSDLNVWEILYYIGKIMAPFSGQIGQNFLAACELAIEQFLKKYPQGDLDSGHLCDICMDARPQTIFAPCGHLTICDKCCEERKRRESINCPSCNKKFNQAFRFPNHFPRLCTFCLLEEASVFNTIKQELACDSCWVLRLDQKDWKEGTIKIYFPAKADEHL